MERCCWVGLLPSRTELRGREARLFKVKSRLFAGERSPGILAHSQILSCAGLSPPLIPHGAPANIRLDLTAVADTHDTHTCLLPGAPCSKGC